MRPSPTTTGTAPAGALVRVRIEGADGLDHLPPVPDGHRVSVTLSSVDLLPTIDELERRGYRVAGVVEPPLLALPTRSRTRRLGTGGALDILVSAPTQASAPEWWRGLVLGAERVFNLELGPVRSVLAPVLAAHAGA